MTDAQLRDAAVAELKLTTAGWRKPNGNPNYSSGTAPATTHWGKAMSLLAQIGQTSPPPTGFAIPTFEAVGRPSGDAIAQTWVLYTSPTTSVGHWGDSPAREIRTADSWEWWMLHEVWIDPAWNEANEGNAYALGLDAHNVPGDVGWSDVPPASGVSAWHTRYKRGDLILQHEPNSPNIWTIKADITKGVWHSVAYHVILGRTDGSTPQPGRTRVYVDGPLALDTGPISNLQRNPSTGRVQAKMTVLDGVYWPGLGSEHRARLTVSRWGKTLQEALADQSLTLNGEHEHADLDLNAIVSRLSSDFKVPSGV